MRQLILALSAFAVIGFAIPVSGGPANAEKIIIKEHRGPSFFHPFHRPSRVVVIRRHH